jgi:probable HAF family extracellular repeat protein
MQKENFMLLRIALLAIAASCPILANVTYGVIAISPQGATMAGPDGVTANGMLAGTNDSFVYHNSGGAYTPLGFNATGLTDTNAVTGQFLLQMNAGFSGSSYLQGYFYNGSSWLSIANPYANDSANAVGMTSSGALVGNVSTPSGTNHAIVWNSNGTWVDLNSLAGGYSNIEAVAANASGRVVGSADGRAFVYNGSSVSLLNTPGSTSSRAEAISSDNRITGSQNIGGANRAFVTDSLGVVTDLGTLGGLNSSGLGVNALGQVVGWSQLANGTQSAFLYSNGVMSDLNSLLTLSGSWVIQSAIAINQSGIILATAINGLGQYQTVLLNPEVPEPSTMLLSVASLAALYLRRRSLKNRL